MNNTWTDERDDILRARRLAGGTVESIATELDASESAVNSRVSKLGLPLARIDLWSGERDDLLRAAFGRGDSASQTAKDFGDVSRNAVIGRLHRLGLRRSTEAKKTTMKLGGSQGARISARASKPKPAPAPVMKVTPLPKPRPAPSASRPTPFVLTGPHDCLWSLEPLHFPAHAEMMVCAARVVEGRKYCEFHDRLSGAPHQPKRTRPPYGATVVRVAS